MLPSATTILLSRVCVPLLGLVVWSCYYQGARLAYKLPRSAKRAVFQLSLVLGAAGIFALQVQLMDHLAPGDAHGSYFRAFILIECGGVLVLGFWTLLRERARAMKNPLKVLDTKDLRG